MHRIAKSVLVALFAVMSMGALAATSASAAEPLFLNESRKALLFTADGLGAATLRGKRAGAVGTIKCNTSSGHGFVLDKSPLAREVKIEFKGSCEQEALGSKGTCTEPIELEGSALGELGLLNGDVYLLLAPESGKRFVTVKCTNGNTEVEGAVLGLFKLKGRDGGSQYGTDRKDFLLLFNVNKTTPTNQEPEEVELLGTLMTGVGLKVEGFLGEKASQEAVALILLDGNGLIDP